MPSNTLLLLGHCGNFTIRPNIFELIILKLMASVHENITSEIKLWTGKRYLKKSTKIGINNI